MLDNERGNTILKITSSYHKTWEKAC